MTGQAAERHLVAVWNPSYVADAMDAHRAMLLQFMAEERDGKRKQEDVYVWWGRIRSGHRLAPLPHLNDVLALDARLEDDDAAELHLYLTDYRSLYVGDVYQLTADDVRADDSAHVPPYYADHPCDCWFQ